MVPWDCPNGESNPVQCKVNSKAIGMFIPNGSHTHVHHKQTSVERWPRYTFAIVPRGGGRLEDVRVLGKECQQNIWM